MSFLSGLFEPQAPALSTPAPLLTHFGDVPWLSERWPNFQPAEVACRHCGEIYYDPADYDALQRTRDNNGKWIVVNSAHRCALHNRQVGGAALSMHKKNAFDLSLRGQDPLTLLNAAKSAGFTGFGYYGTFLHVDRGRPRFWMTKAGERTWKTLLAR